MTPFQDFIRDYNHNLLCDRARALMATKDLPFLEKLWDDWDGMALIEIDSEYIPERELLIELQRRGSDRGI